MTAVLWPLVALVAVVLAFVVALRLVERSGLSPASVEEVATLRKQHFALVEATRTSEVVLTKRVEEVENRVKVIDGRTAPPVRGVR